MPVIDVEIVAIPGIGMPRGLAQRLADALGAALDAPPTATWIRLRTLASDCYAESGVRVHSDELPVFVTVLKRHPPEAVQRATECELLARIVGDIVGRPANCVHIEYAPAGAGRVAFGGKLVE